MTTTEKLAAALRTAQAALGMADLYVANEAGAEEAEQMREAIDGARAALAEYDAGRIEGPPAEHDHEPWSAGQYAPDEASQPYVRVWDRQGRLVADCRVDANGHNNARRIVACVNACAGISTAALEAGIVTELLDERGEAVALDLESVTREGGAA